MMMYQFKSLHHQIIEFYLFSSGGSIGLLSLSSGTSLKIPCLKTRQNISALKAKTSMILLVWDTQTAHLLYTCTVEPQLYRPYGTSAVGPQLYRP